MKITYSVWGTKHTATALVKGDGSTAPKYANGKPQPDTQWLHYTIEATNLQDAMQQYHNIEGHT